jgi:prepilin-type N-terminal cleavage/methylation domain-containing protein
MTRRAFSLAELMVVIAVIGVAGALAMFGMSSQVGESRARADSEALLRSLRAEHRVAKERMVGLSVKPITGGVGVKHQVVFQETARGAPCGSTGVGPKRTVEFANALLSLNRHVLCFNEHGEPVDGATDTGEAILEVVSSGDEVLLAAASGTPTGTPESEKRRLHRLRLRLDRNGINPDDSSKVREIDAAVPAPAPPAPPASPPLPSEQTQPAPAN